MACWEAEGRLLCISVMSQWDIQEHIEQKQNIEDPIFGHAVCFYFLVLLLIELFSEKWV